MSSFPRAAPRNHTHLKEFHKNGQVEIVTTDRDVIERARLASKCPNSTATFVYFDGEEDERVIGRVTLIRDDEPRFRFSVIPE